MKQLKSRVDLFISVPPGLSRPITGYLAANGWCASVQEIRNRGRDVLPFVCQQLPWVIDRGYSLFAKIHTKKSTHLQHGSDWGQWLQREIVAALADGAVVEQLRLDSSIGLMAPAGSIVPATLHLADNVRWMTYLAALLGHDPATILTSSFVAGTMMIGRVAALRRLLDLGLTVESFEVESGQLDGTLAHAIERMLGILCTLGGFEIAAFEPSRELRMNLGYKR
jgi:lipopolysaccharide biosynthesis protein